jgi:hypothetical protein
LSSRTFVGAAHPEQKQQPERHVFRFTTGNSDQDGVSKRRSAMMRDQQGEPPSWLKPPVFKMGQDKRGNWVVQDQQGTRGGLFVNREAALRYLRAENGFESQAVVMVSNAIELDMNRSAGATSRGEAALDPANWRRIA